MTTTPRSVARFFQIKWKWFLKKKKRLFSILGYLIMSVLKRFSGDFGLCDVDNWDVSFIQDKIWIPNNSYVNSPTNKQPICLEGSSFPAIRQRNCSRESSSPVYEIRRTRWQFVEKRHFHELQKFVNAEISATNKRLWMKRLMDNDRRKNQKNL